MSTFSSDLGFRLPITCLPSLSLHFVSSFGVEIFDGISSNFRSVHIHHRYVNETSLIRNRESNATIDVDWAAWQLLPLSTRWKGLLVWAGSGAVLTFGVHSFSNNIEAALLAVCLVAIKKLSFTVQVSDVLVYALIHGS